jgi:hypothetical protein
MALGMTRIEAAVLIACVSMVGQHALAENEPKVITLSCDGTRTDTSSAPTIPIDHEPKPIEKMGVVANLNERTVSFQGWVAPIISVDAASINFDGEPIGTTQAHGYTQTIDGYLDRVTGHLIADTMTYETKKLSDANAVVTRDHYDVLCKATNRVF